MTEFPPQDEDFENMLPSNFEEAVFSIRVVKLANQKLQNDWIKYQAAYTKQVNELQFKVIDLNKQLCMKQEKVDKACEENHK